MEKPYLEELENLKSLARDVPNTRMLALAKITTLAVLNMRYAGIMIDRNLDTHPFVLVREMIKDGLSMLSAWREVSFIEDPEAQPLQRTDMDLEQGHQALFQKLWVNFSETDYTQRIERYVHRLRINKLGDLLKGSKCVDFGCGHGNFAHALLHEGAEYVYGLDFGEDSIAYALKARDYLGVPAERIDFKLESVYSVSKEDNLFDFAIQNGVFHHLENEDDAYREVWRVLKPGGWFWIYTDGSGGISYDLWDASVEMLKEIPHELIISHLAYLNIGVGKRYHLGDGLNAVYRHTSWAELTARLGRLGFGNFRRLTGGFPTDFDDDVIAADNYGREKFGEGDLRLLAQKIA